MKKDVLVDAIEWIKENLNPNQKLELTLSLTLDEIKIVSDELSIPLKNKSSNIDTLESDDITVSKTWANGEVETRKLY